MPGVEWDIGRQGRSWSGPEAGARFSLAPEKLEMVQGKLLWDDEERVQLLALLLENVGVDRAVRLGSGAVWEQALASRVADELAAADIAQDVVIAEPDARYLGTVLKQLVQAQSAFVRGVEGRLAEHERALRDIERDLRGVRSGAGDGPATGDDPSARARG